MPTVIVQHQVKDTQHWLASSTRGQALGQLGASNLRTFVDQGNPQQVALLMDVEDVDALMGALESAEPELIEAMDRDGVLPETISIFVAS